MSDLVRGANLGPEFDLGVIQANTVRLKIGAGLAIQPDGTIVAVPPTSQVAVASLIGLEGNANNVALSLAGGQQTLGTALVFNGANTALEVASALVMVELTAFASYEYDLGNANIGAQARVSPILRLEKDRGGTVTILASSATGYQRHATGHNDSSNTIAWRDLDPQVGDLYQLVSSRGSTQTDPMPITHGQFTAKGSAT